MIQTLYGVLEPNEVAMFMEITIGFGLEGRLVLAKECEESLEGRIDLRKRVDSLAAFKGSPPGVFAEGRLFANLVQGRHVFFPKRVDLLKRRGKRWGIVGAHGFWIL
jgi:hypothetical protein